MMIPHLLLIFKDYIQPKLRALPGSVKLVGPAVTTDHQLAKLG